MGTNKLTVCYHLPAYPYNLQKGVNHHTMWLQLSHAFCRLPRFTPAHTRSRRHLDTVMQCIALSAVHINGIFKTLKHDSSRSARRFQADEWWHGMRSDSSLIYCSQSSGATELMVVWPEKCFYTVYLTHTVPKHYFQEARPGNQKKHKHVSVYFYVGAWGFIIILTQQHRQPHTTADAVKLCLDVFQYHLVMIPSDIKWQPAQFIPRTQNLLWFTLCQMKQITESIAFVV